MPWAQRGGIASVRPAVSDAFGLVGLANGPDLVTATKDRATSLAATLIALLSPP